MYDNKRRNKLTIKTYVKFNALSTMCDLVKATIGHLQIVDKENPFVET